jgi:hypothetical protein
LPEAAPEVTIHDVPKRIFSVDDANRMLPLVSRIVNDVVHQHAIWRERVELFEVLSARSRADQPDPDAEALQREVQSLAAEIDGFLAELADLGVELKDFGRGLVDFPARIADRDVYLCWQLGEPAVEHWHDRDAGFAGRQPLGPHALT